MFGIKWSGVDQTTIFCKCCRAKVAAVVLMLAIRSATLPKSTHFRVAGMSWDKIRSSTSKAHAASNSNASIQSVYAKGTSIEKKYEVNFKNKIG